ncbi:hypothetical protein [Acinetobacter sp.]|uniref:hypothetical protein n=1 Tax=Acinetobacter sp. TaxID=472 RepID=UPI0035B182AF
MLTALQQKLNDIPKALWVQMYRDRMQMLDHQGHVLHHIYPAEKYDHPRSILDQFHAAESTLGSLLKMQKQPWYDPAPILFLQINESWEGGLTFIERRALKEMSYNAGARQALLFDQHGDLILEERNQNAPAFSLIGTLYSKILLLIILVLIIASRYWL